jgi:glutamate/tyrosine decarboxylase-like PLP-dependent enzyme
MCSRAGVRTVGGMTRPSLFVHRPDEFRSLGHQAIEAIAARMASLADGPVAAPASRAEMEARLREPVPEHGSDAMDVLDAALRDVLSPGLRVDHPRFFGYVPLPSDPVGVVADALATGFGTFAGTWLAAPGAATVELVVLDWLRELCGLPRSTEGLFVSGGSVANLTALAVALAERGPEDRGRAVVYLSDETHSSLRRACRVLGVQVRVLPTDREQRLIPAAVAWAVAADRAHRLVPLAVAATAGTTGTGAVDPLPELRRLCDHEELWLHVDGAYGAAGVLCAAGRALLAGLDSADSLTMDPHKWLFQPLEAGCLLVRDGAALRRSFAVVAPYLRDAEAGTDEVNFADRGLQLTRQFRALKLWMSLKTYGLNAFRDAVAHGVALAEHAERVLRADPTWEVVTPARLGIVTFRAVAEDADVAALPAAALADGFAYASTTRVDSATVLRLCTINPRTTPDDVERTIRHLAALLPRRAAAAPVLPAAAQSAARALPPRRC